MAENDNSLPNAIDNLSRKVARDIIDTALRSSAVHGESLRLSEHDAYLLSIKALLRSLAVVASVKWDRVGAEPLLQTGLTHVFDILEAEK